MSDDVVIKIPGSVIHYGRFNPELQQGGVESFAKSLRIAFEDVQFLDSRSHGPGSAAMQRAVANGVPVVCDNHLVMDWPDGYPVIGFQHGVAAEKMFITRARTDWHLARKQAQAARRQATIWVACAKWISKEFARRYGNQASHIIYHAIDTSRFDGRLVNRGSKLVLHDGRSRHKGRDLYPVLQEALPDWRFEALSCDPSQVPERLRGASAFLHLSRYEGNSIVCNEAMAMGLPCLFTKVGLMRDEEFMDVSIVEVRDVYRSRKRLIKCVGAFLGGLETISCTPRDWIVENASQDAFVQGWRKVMADWQHMKQNVKRGS